MKSIKKALFTIATLSVLFLVTSCSMNVRSGLAGKKFLISKTDSGFQTTIEFGRTNELTCYQGTTDHYLELYGTYNVTSKDTVIFELTTLKEVLDNKDITSELTEKQKNDYFKQLNGTYTFTLEGQTLTFVNISKPEEKITATLM